MGIWALGFVSVPMDISSELIHSLLPVFKISVLGASMHLFPLSIGLLPKIPGKMNRLQEGFSACPALGLQDDDLTKGSYDAESYFWTCWHFSSRHKAGKSRKSRGNAPAFMHFILSKKSNPNEDQGGSGQFYIAPAGDLVFELTPEPLVGLHPVLTEARVEIPPQIVKHASPAARVFQRQCLFQVRYDAR